jgi:murein DD-endopeptidase MepM/ murein hydrolase activator NlpD
MGEHRAGRYDFIRAAAAIAFAGLVAGCAGGGTSDAPAPVFLKGAEVGFPGQQGFGSRSVAPRRSDGRRIVVQHGQSLREVAQSYQVSEQAIIAANHLRPPYRVVAGQPLLIPGRIEPSAQPAVAAAPLAAPIARGAAAGRPPPDIIPLDGPTPARAAPAQNSAGLSPPPPPAQRPAREASAADEAGAESSGPAEAPKHGGRFAWPVRGRVVAGYGVAAGGSHNDGINIAAARGTPVAAVDGGTIAYAGNELRGYGNLVLVKHPSGWITAYAHLDELLVKQGDKVNRGQIIAKVGATGGVGEPQLHFELRRGKKAVDPREFLAPAPSAGSGEPAKEG